MFDRLKPQNAAFLVLLAVAGVSITGIGVLLKDSSPTFFALFTTVGGTAFGSAIGISFTRIFEPSQMDSLLKVLAESNRSSVLATAEDRYADFRKPMHGYLRSRDVDGQAIWRYRLFDFGVSRTPGHLHTVVDVPRPDGKIRKFIYDGYICGHHLILIGQPVIAGSEEHVIHVFPDALTNQAGTVSGLCFVDSFDNSRLVTPTILSDKQLTSQAAPGPVTDDQFKLQTTWKSQLAQRRELNFDPDSFTATNR